MCVEIDRRVEKVTNRVWWVWKAINSRSTLKYWRPIVLPGRFRRGQWVRAENPQYGFQCYALKPSWCRSAIRARVRRVEGFGTDCGVKVIFAREVFVPQRRKGER